MCDAFCVRKGRVTTDKPAVIHTTMENKAHQSGVSGVLYKAIDSPSERLRVPVAFSA